MIKRYGFLDYALSVVELEDGEYVKYSDYEDIEEVNKQLHDAISEYQQQINGLIDEKYEVKKKCDDLVNTLINIGAYGAPRNKED